MKVGIAYNAFFSSFEEFFPGLELVNPKKRPEYDLIIFSGGEDINPSIYGQSNRSSSYSENRDTAERYIFHNALDYGIKILGVCRGHQLINAVLGGNLVQDLYTAGVPHKGNHGFDFNRQTWIPGIVNSMHHQGVIQAGRNMNVVATHNGIIEATVSNTIISVQWHPEFMGDIEFFNFIKAWVAEKVDPDISLNTVITNKQFSIYSSQHIKSNKEDNSPLRISDFGSDSNILFDDSTPYDSTPYNATPAYESDVVDNNPDTARIDDLSTMRVNSGITDTDGNPIILTYRIQSNTTNTTRGGI